VFFQDKILDFFVEDAVYIGNGCHPVSFCERKKGENMPHATKVKSKSTTLSTSVSVLCADSSVVLSLGVDSCNSYCTQKEQVHKYIQISLKLFMHLQILPPKDSHLRGFFHCPVQWK